MIALPGRLPEGSACVGHGCSASGCAARGCVGRDRVEGRRGRGLRRPPLLPALISLVALLPLLGCDLAPTRTESTDPGFVLRRLELHQKDPFGRRQWDLSSPESRYDLQTNVAQTLQPQGVIYADGQPRYSIRAESGVVLKDGEVVQLEGDILLQRLGKEPLAIRAARARWFPGRALIELDRHPQVLDGRLRLLAGRARFQMDKELLELLEKPRLAGWTQPFAPVQGPAVPAEWELSLPRLRWQVSQGGFDGPGPVQGWRRPPQRPSQAPPQRLQAHALRGNSRLQVLDLQGPLRLEDPLERSQLLAQRLLVQPTGLQADDCRYSSPTGRSEAQRCGWDPRQQQVWADRSRSQLVVPRHS